MKTIVPVLFLLSSISVSAFGAGSALPNETALWQSKIDATSAAGGGVVSVPAGRHVVAGLFLRDNVELRLEKGAIVEGPVGLEHYPVLTMPHSEGTWSAIIMATNVSHVAVTGEGEIFGNGALWPQPKGPGGMQEGQRARGLFFADSQDIRLEGFFLRDAACWGVVFKCCDGVVARRVRIDNHANFNNDGFDIEAANALFENCDVDASDDAFVLKSNNPDFAVTNVVVRDSIARSHCNALKLGTASHGTMANVLFKNVKCLPPRRDFLCNVPGHPREGKSYWSYRPGASDYPAGVGISALCVECVDGGRVESVRYEDVEIDGYMVPVFVRGGTRKGRGTGTPPGTQYVFRDISFRNVKGTGCSPTASSVTGVDGCRVRDVSFENVSLVCRGAGEAASSDALETPVADCAGRYPEATMFRHILPAYGLYIDRADDVTLTNVTFTLREGTTDLRPPVCRTENTDIPRVLGAATTREEWEGGRRAEVKKALEDVLYGRRPVERPGDLAFVPVSEEPVFDGTAVKKRVRATCSGPGGAMALELTAWIPKKDAKVPAFVYLSPRRTADCDDPATGRPEYTLPAKYIVSRGYAVVAVNDYESAPDWKQAPELATNGVFLAFGPRDAKNRGEATWGILSAWAWGASRALDWLETEARVDARRTAVCGLSRNGKAALVAGAFDERFAMAVSCCSGEGGAKLRRWDCPGSETVKDISIAWRWFAPGLEKWIGRDREMPLDQHWLLAMMAPRLCYVSSATQDDWAGPRGEYASAVLASEAWRLYGKKGLVSTGFPRRDLSRKDGEIGYHVRTGKHALTLDDWRLYLDFADKHM